MSTARLPLYERLPEIYRIRDEEQKPPQQLKAFVGVIDDVYAKIRDHIEQLYHDRFIDTCDDWVIAYIADLLGTSHLTGDPWTLRADVARTVFHRRRKGTLGAIESLTFSLSGWAAHASEMRERLAWTQHLNHQRPDAGGIPPQTLTTHISEPVRGGTVNLRSPALLSLVNTAFDPFAHVVDVKPPHLGLSGLNLPNLGIFLWRLEDYTVLVSQPAAPLAPVDQIVALTPDPGEAAVAVRFHLHPMAEPMVLFNSHRFHADEDPPELSSLDAVPGPMPAARLTQDTPAGRPEHYIKISPYTTAPPARPGADAVGLTLHIPEAPFSATNWRIRGANLCAWEAGLHPPLREYEIVVDPDRGRVVFGVMDQTAEAEPLRDELLVSATDGFAGPTGAHPIGRPDAPTTWLDATPTVVTVNFHTSATALQDALGNLDALGAPLIIEIDDSMTHDLDPAAVLDAEPDGTWRLGSSLWIRAKSGERPVIRLAGPLSFRPDDLTNQATLTVKLEGLTLTRGEDFSATDALIDGAALNALIVDGCTLDPGGYIKLDGTPDGTRQPIRDAMNLTNDYGFTSPAEELAFDQTPQIVIQRSILGPLAIDSDYSITLSDSIVDAGSGVEAVTPEYAIHAATGVVADAWSGALSVSGVTFLGRVRVESVTGQGGIFVQQLEAHDNQKGCVKFSYFRGDGDRLPPHHGCVFAAQARLAFTSEYYGTPGYAQLKLHCDKRILENGPNYDQMGAFGYLRNTAKWKNLQIRYREFMPVGVRAVLIPIT
jgi:hypothetical protein